jgi:hypothetical protein
MVLSHKSPNKAVRSSGILSRPIPKAGKLGMLGLLLIIGAAILLQMAKEAKPKPSVVNKGPLDIRLVGVCPDSGEQLYDASGRKLEATLGPLRASNTHSNEKSLCRDFFFEVPDVNDQVLFLPFSHICLAGTSRGLGGGFRRYFDPTDDPGTLIYSITFDRTYRKRVFAIAFEKEIEYIDFTLRYLFGPQREAICSFIGPFTLDQTAQADSNRPYSLTPTQSKGFAEYSGTDLLFTTSQPFDGDSIVVAYDLQGRRYFLDRSSGRSGSSGAKLTYRDIFLPLDRIAVITFGEKPHEITFTNVAVDFPDRPYRTYPEFLDQMSDRLGLTGKSPERLAQYQFKNPQEAIEVIDIVRGNWHVRQALEAVRYGKPKIDIAELDETTQDKIRRAAIEWAETGLLAKYGISLGLMGRWPEFFDMAIERLSREIPYGNGHPDKERVRRQDDSSIANVMINYRMDNFTVEQVQKLKELIIKTDNDSVLRYLLWYLEWTKSQATTDALWELAQDDRPWIWWQATEAWYSRASRTRVEYEGLPEKMKLRLLLINERIKDENLEAKALTLLQEIFTPELGKMASHIWSKIRERISREFDKKVATEIFVNYLRQLQSEMATRQWITNNAFSGISKWMVVYLIKTLNVWYGTNIANLGTDETRISIEQEPRSFSEFQNLIAEAIRWYEGNVNATPIELPFAGKVVDTAGKPIAGAKLHFTKIEDYTDEHGDRRQRRVSGGQCRTDADGKFSFDCVDNSRLYLLDVTAEGYIPKEELHIQRLIDGRYRYQEETTPQDNVVELHRPGKISGVVLGADGKPLANAELGLSAASRYSDTIPRRTITTDSEGMFTAGDVPKGQFLLSYRKYRRTGQGEWPYREYAGLCGAVRLKTTEAGHLTGIVLDLSESVCTLEVKVVDDANKPVQAISLVFAAEMKEGSYHRYPSVFNVNVSNVDGVYRFEGMPSGTWHLYINGRSSRLEHKAIDVRLTPERTARYKVVLDSRSGG